MDTEPVQNTETGRPVIHGTVNAYNKHQCRCHLCRAAKTAQGKKYYQDNRETCLARDKRWRTDNPAKAAAKGRKWVEDNPERSAANRQKRHHRDPGYHRAYHLKATYGLSPAEYEELAREQSGLCGICGETESRVRKGKLLPLAVDHDHKTGKVRGLLCMDCNRALGWFHDDLARIEGAVSYIRKYI